MKPERWQQLDKLFHAALERATRQRSAFLNEACAGDEGLRREVEDLLAAHENAESFIENPAFEVEAEALAEEQVRRADKSISGQAIGHYRIIELLGAGGMGDVYLAQDVKLGRQVALKVLPAQLTEDGERLRRFEQEARAASALNHPNILTIYEIGHADSVRYIATEFIDGVTLRKRLADKTMKSDEAIDVALQVASALAAAHAKGIVHRDIKPENIMISRGSYPAQKENHVKVLDFGIAKLTDQTAGEAEATTRVLLNTHEGSVLGTASYMSPEQARGDKVDVRTDIWSLGIVLYEMLFNRLPFEGDTRQDVIASILKEEPPPLPVEVPDRLRWIVEKALRKHKEERYQTSSEMFSDLREVQRQSGNAIDKPAFRAGDDTAKENADTRAIARPTSSVEYMISGIRKYKGTFSAGLAVLLLAAIGFASWLYTNRTSNTAPIQSLAVLPFINESNNSDVEYLSDGMTESLINSLSQLPNLAVKARGTVFRYKGRDLAPQQVGSELSVQAVLSGRVVQRGDQLTLSLELVDVRTGNQIWGDQYHRKLTDLIALQSEIAQDVSQKLRVRLSSADAQKLAKNYTENSEAYQLYLKGRHFADQFTQEGFKKAVKHFNQAIEKDPNYALAYAGLAEAYWVASAESLPPREAMPKAREAAVKALKIDEQLAEAHTSLAVVLALYDYDFPGGEREFKRAIELNPNSALAHQWYGYYLASVARADEAFKEIKRAQELDPLSLLINMELGMPFYFTRQYDQAIEQFKRVLEMDSNMELARLFLGSSYAQKGMYEEAIAMLSKPESDHPFVLASLGQNSALSGKRSEALKIIDRLNEQSKYRYVSPYGVAKVYLGLGDKEQALRWLEKSYENREDGFIWINTDPVWDGLRSEPRFQGLARRVGFTP